MVRKVTPTEYNRMVRRHNQEVTRVNRANKAAAEKFVRDHNREVTRVNRMNQQIANANNRAVQRRNQNARAAVAKYNQLVRTHNAKVKNSRQQLQQRIAALRNQSNVQYVDVRTSTLELNDQFERIEREAQSSAGVSALLELSEREADNSAAVAGAFVSEEPESPGPAQDSGILEYLSGFSQDLCARWTGALYALNPANPDAGRHFCTSAREIITEILDNSAIDEEVVSANQNCERTPQGSVSRRAKIQYLLKKNGADSPEMLGFVEKDIDDILQLFKIFNSATHGPAGKHGFAQLQNIRLRVEGGIMFLAALAL